MEHEPEQIRDYLSSAGGEGGQGVKSKKSEVGGGKGDSSLVDLARECEGAVAVVHAILLPGKDTPT